MLSRVITFASTVAIASAQTWYGLIADSPDTLFFAELSDKAVVTKKIVDIKLAPGEQAHTDAMRCLVGFCAFTTTVYEPTVQSFVTRINSANGAILSKVPLKGDCAHMHVDFTTNHLYTLCIDDSSSGYSAVITEIASPTPNFVIDITSSVNKGIIRPGQTTHCSAFHSMYVGVNNGGAGKDVIISVDLVTPKVSGTVTLQKSALSRTLWARCDGSNEIGGINWSAGSGPNSNGTAVFGDFSTIDGSYTVWATVGVPNEYEPSGLLTESETEQAIAAFYPVGTRPNSTKVTGYLWAVDPFAKVGDDYVTEYDFNLVAASFDRDGQ
jgi:hypothetical protein